jgi:predicted Fe-Mo cluster-binding NifX family protein
MDKTLVCVTAQDEGLDAVVDPRFGRCLYFTIVNTETMDSESVKNPNIDGMGGVGIQSGQFVAGKNVKVVLTGNVGPNAFQTLQAAGIEVITGITGIVKEVIERYKKGEFTPAQGHSVNSKFGMPPRTK